MYWWSNAAIPETDGTRVIAPADEAFGSDYTTDITRVTPTSHEGYDGTWLVNSPQGCNRTALSARCRSRLYRTSDGGGSWTPILERSYLGAISILDSSTLFAVAAAADCSGYPDTCGSDLWRTLDAGATWSLVSQTATPMWDVRFANLHEGYAARLKGPGLAGTAVIVHTVDGGATWSDELVLPASRIPQLELAAGQVWAMTLPDGMCSMGGCGGYQIWKRTAAGAWDLITADPAWYAHPQPDRLGFLGAPLFTDALHGWNSAGAGAGGGTGGVLHSDDGGATWWRSIVPPYGWDVAALAPIDGSTALIVASEFVGTPPFLARTTDGARTWTKLAFRP
jgi:photosystem II stability/assembly factor-like uncharacterized protein